MVPLFNKFSELITYTFLNKILNRFKDPIEISTKWERKFFKKFHILYKKKMIDHMAILRDQLKENSSAKCIV